MDIWSWISELPNSDEWAVSDSPPVYELARSTPIGNTDTSTTRTIQLRAERTAGSNSEALVTFSLNLQGFHPSNAEKTLWVSDACPLSSDKPFLPLMLQLLQEIIAKSPTAHDSTCPRSQLQKLKPEPVIWIMDSHSPESLSGFFNLVFLTRLFWLCVCDAPADVGSLYFHKLFAPNLDSFSCNHAPVLRTFLISIGVDMELCFMRTLGYMLAKWFILREVGVGLQMLTMPRHNLGFSYAMEAHGLWILKGYAPVWAMTPTSNNGSKNRCSIVEAKESVLRYTLAHQQLEVLIQLEYSVVFHEGHIQVKARVDNMRFQVVKLGYNKNDEVDFANEKHFLSRVRAWIGPEVGSTYVAGLSLGRSTDNVERELEMQRIAKGSFGKSKVPKVKATARISNRSKVRNWRWDQDVEGNAVIFDAILHDNNTGTEVATWNPSSEGDAKLGHNFQKRCSGANRPFTKSGSLVFAGDEYGDGVGWRLNKEMEGSVLKWRIGGQVWLSYWPSDVKSSYFETRCVEWCDEVDLPLIPTK